MIAVIIDGSHKQLIEVSDPAPSRLILPERISGKIDEAVRPKGITMQAEYQRCGYANGKTRYQFYCYKRI